MEDATGVVSPPAGEVVGSGASEGASASAITVNIKTLNGADFELSVDTQELVSELKTKIRRQTDVDETRQRLIYRGKVLADAEPLSTYKVESGHFVHMVARPEGLPPPASAQDAPRSATSNAGNAAPAAAAGGSAADGAQRTDAFGAGLTRVISDRLLMGMGALSAPNAPAAPGRAAGRRQGRHGHNHGMDNALLNAAAGLEQGDFLSNMLALGGDGGGGRAEAAGGTRASRGIPRNPLPDGLVGGRRGARGVRSAAVAATAASPLLGRGADAEQQGALGGGANLEHVRQGLLTLHTLLSGTTASRTRQRPQESPEEDADVSPPQPPTTEATVDGPAAVPDGTNSGAGEGESDSATPVAAVAAVAAASEDEATLTTETLTPAPIAGEEPVPVGAAAGSATNAAAAEAAAGASLKADRRCPDERDVQAAAEAEEEEAAMPSHGPRLSGGSGGGSIGGGGDGSSVPRAWLAPASFDDGTDEEDADGGGEEGGSGEAGEEDRNAGAHAGSRLDGHRLRLSSESGSPLASSRGSRAVSGVSEEEAAESGAESGAEAEAEATAPAEAGSDLSDGPPRLQSESGESGDGEDDEDGGGWEGHRAFLRGSVARRKRHREQLAGGDGDRYDPLRHEAPNSLQRLAATMGRVDQVGFATDSPVPDSNSAPPAGAARLARAGLGRAERSQDRSSRGRCEGAAAGGPACASGDQPHGRRALGVLRGATRGGPFHGPRRRARRVAHAALDTAAPAATPPRPRPTPRSAPRPTRAPSGRRLSRAAAGGGRGLVRTVQGHRACRRHRAAV
ncbi:unnamed protein product [Scytosiphon promiscuus]